MLDLVGAGFILFAGATAGYVVSRQYGQRPQQIRQMIQALQRLETEIGYGMTPLPDAFASIAAQLDPPLSMMFRHAADAMHAEGRATADVWEEAVQSFWKHTALKKAEQDILIRFGHSLGVSDRADQLKHIRLAASQLQYEENQALEEQKKYGKMWRSLGVLGGVLIVIILY